MTFFSAACERNKNPILQQLISWLQANDKVLEIGSGSGQHGVFFAESLPGIIWQCSDRMEMIAGLMENLSTEKLPRPLTLDVMTYTWEEAQYDVVFSANTLHIMPWSAVYHFLTNVTAALVDKGKLILYGPFRYAGEFTSPSNQLFDQQLKTTDPQRGIRDFEQVNSLLQQQGLTLLHDQAMPANNQLLVWQR